MNTASQIINQARLVAYEMPEPVDRLARHVGYLEGCIKQLCAQYENKPDKVCGFVTVYIDDEEAVVSYDYDAGQRGREYGPPELSWENIEPSVQLLAVWIRGACFDAGNFQQALQDKWEQAALEAETDVARDQWESRQAEREY